MKPKVLILGTFHFAGSSDFVQVGTVNLLSENKKREINDVISKLAKFNPTKVAVEFVKESEDTLNEQYENFLKGTYELTVNEIDQIGFQLAKKMNHQKIYSVDWMGDIGSRGIGEVLDWAKKNQPELYELITKVFIPQIEIDLNSLTLQEILKNLNQKERILTDHRMYMNVARIGENTNYVGIDWVRWWYQRNLIIYHNIANLIEKEDDRIMLLIGAGHLHLIKQFLNESGLVEIEEIGKYL
ncbi:DUF5694 domain-containing protein [Ureibacillus sp. MALMAid1270]|uniref:DUF5694 domain-containing protein n=1 Tax=Ureibacillus sp. MALMAid1270 TaxID=3411629 RepID=UPI003BA72E79